MPGNLILDESLNAQHLDSMSDGTMYFDSNVKIARHQLGRLHSHATLIIIHAEIIMANVNSFMA